MLSNKQSLKLPVSKDTDLVFPPCLNVQFRQHMAAGLNPVVRNVPEGKCPVIIHDPTGMLSEVSQGGEGENFGTEKPKTKINIETAWPTVKITKCRWDEFLFCAQHLGSGGTRCRLHCQSDTE